MQIQSDRTVPYLILLHGTNLQYFVLTLITWLGTGTPGEEAASVLLPRLYLSRMTAMITRLESRRVNAIPARIPRKGVNSSGTGDSESGKKGENQSPGKCVGRQEGDGIC